MALCKDWQEDGPSAGGWQENRHLADSRVSANLPAGGSPSRDGEKSLERLNRVCITPYVLTQSINTWGP